MIPADRIQVMIVGSEAAPAWLGEEDHGWLRALIDEFARLEGRPYREVASFLQEPPRRPSAAGKRRMAISTLLDSCTRDRPPLDAAALRGTISVEAQRARDQDRFDRSKVMAACAHIFGLSADAAEECMFADLPGERRLRLPNPLPDPHALAVRTNLALAQGLLRLSSGITLEIYGGARAVVRQVRLRRLLSTVRRAGADGVRIDISGPFSLFRHTTMYGRDLASILPLLTGCERFELAARCLVRGRAVNVHLSPGDPIAVGVPPRPYDSRLEERFARDFGHSSLDWDLVREPEPVEAGGTLVFPDFAVIHRHDPSRRFLLEIVGYWTPEYLRDKLEHLRGMPHVPLVLCIDRGLNCSAGELPAHACVVWFQNRIEPSAVLAAIETACVAAVTHVERIAIGDLFIDWAGRRPTTAPIHRMLMTLKAGAPVQLRKCGSQVVVEAEGETIAVFSRPGCERWMPRLDQIASARLVGMIERRSSQSALRWHNHLQCERWLVPVVEVVLLENR